MSTRPEKYYTMLGKFKVMMKKINLAQKIIIAIYCTVFLVMTLFSCAAASDRKSAIPGDNSSCLVTPLMNQDFFPALLKAIDKAQSEIFISIYSFKAGVHANSYPDQVLAHLARAVKRGVEVKVILEDTGNPHDEITEQNLKTKALLEDKSVTVYLDSPKKTTHTKVVVVDQRLVFLGSHNFTSSALKHNNEISVLIEKPELALDVRNYMLKIIKEAK